MVTVLYILLFLLISHSKNKTNILFHKRKKVIFWNEYESLSPKPLFCNTRVKIVKVPNTSRPVFGPTQSPISWVKGGMFFSWLSAHFVKLCVELYLALLYIDKWVPQILPNSGRDTHRKLSENSDIQTYWPINPIHFHLGSKMDMGVYSRWGYSIYQLP
jgi:hypothetical protein